VHNSMVVACLDDYHDGVCQDCSLLLHIILFGSDGVEELIALTKLHDQMHRVVIIKGPFERYAYTKVALFKLLA
jgi:hypothetical protein